MSGVRDLGAMEGGNMSIARRETTVPITDGSLSGGSEGTGARGARRCAGGRSTRLVALAITTAMVLVLSSCWRQIGANGGQTRFNPVERELNWANVGTLREAWSVDLAGTLSEPVVFDGRAYLTRNAPVDPLDPMATAEAHVHAFDVEDGAVLWEEELASYASADHVGGMAVSFVDDELWSGHFVGVPDCEAAGHVFDPETGDHTVVGTTAPGPTASADGVTARFVHRTARDPENSSCSVEPMMLEVDSRRPDGSGSRWTAPVDNQQLVPTLGREHVYAVVMREFTPTLAAFDIDGCGAATCEPVWESDAGGRGSVVAAEPYGPLYVLTGRDLTALDQTTGNQLWKFESAPWSGPTTGLAVANGIIYVTTPFQLLAFNAVACLWSSTCSPSWTADIPSSSFLGVSKPVVGGGVVYVVAGNSPTTPGASVYAFAAGGCWAEACSPITTVPLESVMPSYVEVSLSEGHLFVAASTVVVRGPEGILELGRGRLIALAPA